MTTKLMNNVNDRTYQEVEYLKKSLGPILVAALAEICIRRPADPVEYLGHWLLRWRYNEELKRRDVVNAMDVVKQRQWNQIKEDTAASLQQESQPEPVGQEVPDDQYRRGLIEEEEANNLEDETEQETETLFAPQGMPEQTRLSIGSQKKGSIGSAKKSMGSPRTSLGDGGRKASDKSSRKGSKEVDGSSSSRKGSYSLSSGQPLSEEERKQSGAQSDTRKSLISNDSISTKKQSASGGSMERKTSSKPEGT